MPRRGRIVSASFDLKSEIKSWSKMWQGVNSLKNSSHYRTLTRFWLPPTPLWPHCIQQDYVSLAEMGSDFVLANSTAKVCQRRVRGGQKRVGEGYLHIKRVIWKFHMAPDLKMGFKVDKNWQRILSSPLERPYCCKISILVSFQS